MVLTQKLAKPLASHVLTLETRVAGVERSSACDHSLHLCQLHITDMIQEPQPRAGRGQGFLCWSPLPASQLLLSQKSYQQRPCNLRKKQNSNSCNDLSASCMPGSVLKVICTHYLILTTGEVGTTLISVLQKGK